MLTIFTPTYNREKLLKNVYNSLIRQTCLDFEWLIIDDGSTDNTTKVVDKFISEKKLRIRYIKKENGGKHTAHNVAVENAQGNLFLCLDSDDILSQYAVEIIINNIYKLLKDDCGFICYKSKSNGELLSKAFKNDFKEHCGLFELNTKHHVVGEFALVFKTDILRKFLFPVFKGEYFIGENVLYDKLEQKGYKFCPLPNVIEICEYQQDGLSSNFDKIIKNNPAGYCLYFMQRIDMQKNFLSRLVICSKYHAFCFFASKNKTKYIGKNRFFVKCTIPTGWICWLYYKLARKF